MIPGTPADAVPEPSRPSFPLRTLWITLAVIVVDQVTKIIVLNTMERGQSIEVLGDWLRFTFTENPGMAFGIEYGPPAVITLFSIAATALIVVYLRKVGHYYAPYRVSLAFVLGGALGNIIDRVFYGAILYDAPLFLGRVVDFIHINVWRGYVADSVPVLGGKYLALFPIWNVADMAIVGGVVGILLFQRRFHEVAGGLETDPDNEPASTESDAASGTDGISKGLSEGIVAVDSPTSDVASPSSEAKGS